MVGFLLGTNAGVKAVAQGAPGAGPATISLGIVSQKPTHKIEEHRDFVNYLARKLSSVPDANGVVVVTPTALELAKLLGEKKVDFYMESPYPTFVINKQIGARILLRRWKGGVGEYRSIIFARGDRGAARLDDLLGKMIAFEDPGSTSGYFLPKVLFFQKGFKLTEKPSFEAKVSGKEIGYLFAQGSEKNLRNWVLTRKVAAAAYSDNDFAKLDEKTKQELVILAETPMFPRHLLSVRKDLDPAIADRLKNILLSMHRDEEGQKILKKTDQTTKFDELPGGEESFRRRFREVFSPQRLAKAYP
jgi:phosphonate transport system substrate-binding protein